jgi:hypothetical protein
MSDNSLLGSSRPPLTDQARHIQFTEPERPVVTPALSTGYESTITLPLDSEDYDNDDYIEKVPLTSDQGTAGFYPPG